MGIIEVAALVAAFFVYEQAPTAADVLARAIEAEKKQGEIERQYAYTETKIETQIDKQGRPTSSETKTYEAVPLEGELYRKLVMIDGKPLSEKLQKKVDEELKKAKEERQKARRSSLRTIRRQASLSGLERLADLYVNEVVDDGEFWRVESKARVDAGKVSEAQKQAMCWDYTSWIDKKTGLRRKWRSVVVRPVNGFQPGSEVEFERGLGTENVWLLREIRGNFELKVMKVLGGRVKSVQRFEKYQKFEVDSSLKVEQP